MQKLLLIIFWVLLITATAYAHDIYDPKNQFLYVGGASYLDAQSVVLEELDRPLGRSIVRFDIKAKKRETFYSSGKYIKLVKLSPDAKNIAINEAELTNTITIVDANRSLVTTLDKTVGEFEWSPDGRYLAYITGKVTAEAQVPFMPESLWIYDTFDRRASKIADKAIKIRFARHDGKLHYWIRAQERTPVKVMVYDQEAKTQEPTTCYGLDFSPDGKHYIREYTDSGANAVFFSHDNKKLRELHYDIEAVYWLSSDAVFNFFLPNSFVFDPFRLKVLRGFQGPTLGWSPDRKYIVTYKNKEAVVTESLTGSAVARVRIRE